MSQTQEDGSGLTVTLAARSNLAAAIGAREQLLAHQVHMRHEAATPDGTGAVLDAVERAKGPALCGARRVVGGGRGSG